jgi:hypothetical protein
MMAGNKVRSPLLEDAEMSFGGEKKGESMDAPGAVST